MRLLDLVFGRKLKFKSQYSPHESAQRLGSNIESSIWKAWNTTCVVGKVTDRGIWLVWHRAYIRNSFRPIFRGLFEIENGTTIIEGRFGMHLFVRIFLAIWFGGLILGGIVCVHVGYQKFGTEIFNPDERLFELLGYLSFIAFLWLAGVGLIAWGKYVSRDSLEKITGVIEKSLGNTKI